MRSDFDLIVHKIGTGSIEVLPISDVHYGAVEHNEEAWNRLLTYIRDNPHVYAIIGGDMMNNATRSSVSNIFEETVRPREQKRYMVKALDIIKRYRNGDLRRRIIEICYWKNTHTIDGAALIIHVSPRTAHEWDREFIGLVDAYRRKM